MRFVLAALFASTMLLAPIARADPSRLVLGSTIGAVSIGQTRQSVVAAYRTAGGFGVGSRGTAARALGFGWNAQCTLSYLRSGGGMFTEIFTRGHLPAGKVIEIYFIKAAYAGDC